MMGVVLLERGGRLFFSEPFRLSGHRSRLSPESIMFPSMEVTARESASTWNGVKSMTKQKPTSGVPGCMLVAMTRRKMLKRGAAASAALGLAACGTLPGEFGTVVEQTLDIGPQTFSLDDEGFTGLATVGGLAYWKIEEGDTELELVLVRSADDEILAFDHRCPHQQFGIGPAPDVPEALVGEWDADNKVIICKWHQSAFEPSGTFREDLSQTVGTPNIAIYDVAFDAANNSGTVTFG